MDGVVGRVQSQRSRIGRERGKGREGETNAKREAQNHDRSPLLQGRSGLCAGYRRAGGGALSRLCHSISTQSSHCRLKIILSTPQWLQRPPILACLFSMISRLPEGFNNFLPNPPVSLFFALYLSVQVERYINIEGSRREKKERNLPFLPSQVAAGGVGGTFFSPFPYQASRKTMDTMFRRRTLYPVRLWRLKKMR